MDADLPAPTAPPAAAAGAGDQGSGQQRVRPALQKVFRNRFGHGRAGWRIAAYLLACLVIGQLFRLAFHLLLGDLADMSIISPGQQVAWLGQNLALLLAALGLLRWLDRRPAALLGLSFAPGWVGELLLGLAGGVVLISGLALLLLLTGSVSLEPAARMSDSFAFLPGLALALTLAAGCEELFFRGYPLQALAEGSRRWIAVTILCLLFSLVHLGNPDVTPMALLNIFLVGILLAVAYFRTLRLWLPFGLHLSWNLSQCWLWGFDVSGFTIARPLVVARTTGAELLTGGEFGLEGSLLTSLLLVLVTWWLARTPAVTPAPASSALWDRYPRGLGLPPVVPTGGGDDAQEQPVPATMPENC